MNPLPINALLDAIAAVVREPAPKEFCGECGGVFPAGSHVWVDLDGVEHEGCTNFNRGQAYLYGMRAFLDPNAPDEGMRRAKGYAVK